MNQKDIGSFLAELRKEKNMTQMEFGEKLGVTNKTVSRWENGNYMPDLSMIQEICKELDISINEFISGKRLDEASFQNQAEKNMAYMINREAELREANKISSSFGAVGAGALTATLTSPSMFNRVFIGLFGLALIFISWYYRSKVDKAIFGDESYKGKN